ncbi:MAG: hypothetical protein EB824_02520 [Thaumarchaeota archaeon S15]|nr:hypothetical protein [Nitrososphaerota archaeon]RNJ73466.1 MAG: hypothetical protein EB833_02840 [Thaumarchaeota archaeon S13]RNJ74952.1 MAG: hypothetical protein EB824_02520 [Thaumarchaeota archaeon S15]
MPGDIRVSLTLDGLHLLESDEAKKACGDMERALSESHVPYTIYCLDREFSRRGKKSPERILISIDRSSYDVFWEALSAFRVPETLHSLMTSSLKPMGKVRVRASVEIDQVPITLPTIDDGSMGEKVSMIMFDLPPPGTARKGRDCDVSLGGMARLSGTNKALISLFGERESSIADAARTTDCVLGALSTYCEAYTK